MVYCYSIDVNKLVGDKMTSKLYTNELALEVNQRIKEIGAIIKQTRLAINMSGAKLSLTCGFSKNYITLTEAGKMGMPKLSSLIKIAEALSIPKEELLKIAGYDVGKENKSMDINSEIINELTQNKVTPEIINSLINIINYVKDNNNFESTFREKWKTFALDYNFFSNNDNDKKIELKTLESAGAQFVDWLNKENKDLLKNKRRTLK